MKHLARAEGKAFTVRKQTRQLHGTGVKWSRYELQSSLSSHNERGGWRSFDGPRWRHSRALAPILSLFCREGAADLNAKDSCRWAFTFICGVRLHRQISPSSSAISAKTRAGPLCRACSANSRLESRDGALRTYSIFDGASDVLLRVIPRVKAIVKNHCDILCQYNRVSWPVL